MKSYKRVNIYRGYHPDSGIVLVTLEEQEEDQPHTLTIVGDTEERWPEYITFSYAFEALREFAEKNGLIIHIEKQTE